MGLRSQVFYASIFRTKKESAASSEILETAHLNKWRQVPKYSDIQNAGLTYFILISSEGASVHSAWTISMMGKKWYSEEFHYLCT